MTDQKTSSKKIDDSVIRAVNFELTIADLAKRSERRAWWVAIVAVVVALILLGGYFYILPLKEKVPYVVMADAYTGTSSVARLTDDFTNRQITTSEAINRSNVAHFVLARESYDVAMMNMHDWATVLTMSSPGVSGAYTRLYSASNPDNPFKSLGRDKAIRVKILSIVLVGAGLNLTPKGATVRFQRSLYNKMNGSTRPMDSEIATMTFVYKANLKMDDQYRVDNPLGFQVNDYRVDNDASVSAPAEVLGAPLTTSAVTQIDSASATGPAVAASAASTSADQLAPPLPMHPPMPEHEARSASASAVAPPTKRSATGVRHQ